jgi:hypothetical protein
MASLPPDLHPLFWDCRTDTIDTESQAQFVLERVLEYGSLAAVRWALATFGAERIKEFLRHRGVRTLSRKTLSFWTLLLGIEEEPCFERSSLTFAAFREKYRGLSPGSRG